MKIRIPQVLLFTFFVSSTLSYASYQVMPGDTLTQIAESKYGNWIKWQDLWKVNKAHVADPNLIYPGQRLKLLTDEELDLYAVNGGGSGKRHANDGDPSDGPSRVRRRSGHSEEWRLLPLQNWEKYVFKLSPAIDPDGFDRRSKVAVRVADKSTADVTIASDRIAVLGEITHARTEYERVFLGQQVFVRADEQLQVGAIYSVTTGPQKMVSVRDGRVGFSYDLTGKVKIIGVRDNLFIATVTALYHPIQRHQLLIPEVPDYQFVHAVPAPAPLPASVLTTEALRNDMLSEQKIVFIDAGSNEGIKPGMIFRHYLHTDPGTHETISTKDFLIEAELQVVSVIDKFSVAIILKSPSITRFGDELIALTDLKDFDHHQGLQSALQDGPASSTVDELDQMDSTDGLGEKENRDLRQLEKWSQPLPDTAAPAAEGDESDIQRIDTHEHPRKAVEIGNETAPNDGSAKKPQTAPNTPKTETAPPVESTPPAPPLAPGDTVPAAPEPSGFVEPSPGTTIPAAPVAPAPAAPGPVTPAPPPALDPFSTPAPN